MENLDKPFKNFAILDNSFRVFFVVMKLN